MTFPRNRLTAADEDILSEAARWLGRAHDGLSAAEKRAFRDWLEARTEHAAAADAVARAWAIAPQAAGHAGLAAPVRRIRIAQARRWLAHLAPEPRLIAAALILPLAVFGAWWLANIQRADYATGATQRLAVSLPDGSRIWLAPRTHLSARIDPFGRHVWLHQGEAMLQVAHRDATFAVDAGAVRIVDRGTAFDVRKRDDDLVSIVLVEGRIEVRDRASGRTLAIPAPDERVAVRRGDVAVTRTDAEAATAWRNGRLVFDDRPLGAALAAFAEQGAPPVTLDDAALGRIRISGAFATSDIESFLSALAELHPVVWRRTARGYCVKRRAA